MHSQKIIQIVSLKILTSYGCFRRLRSGKRIGLSGDISDVVVAIFKKGIHGGGIVN
jgi:hypothetical protein